MVFAILNAPSAALSAVDYYKMNAVIQGGGDGDRGNPSEGHKHDHDNGHDAENDNDREYNREGYEDDDGDYEKSPGALQWEELEEMAREKGREVRPSAHTLSRLFSHNS